MSGWSVSALRWCRCWVSHWDVFFMCPLCAPLGFLGRALHLWSSIWPFSLCCCRGAWTSHLETPVCCVYLWLTLLMEVHHIEPCCYACLCHAVRSLNESSSSSGTWPHPGWEDGQMMTTATGRSASSSGFSRQFCCVRGMRGGGRGQHWCVIMEACRFPQKVPLSTHGRLANNGTIHGSYPVEASHNVSFNVRIIWNQLMHGWINIRKIRRAKDVVVGHGVPKSFNTKPTWRTSSNKRPSAASPQVISIWWRPTVGQDVHWTRRPISPMQKGAVACMLLKKGNWELVFVVLSNKAGLLSNN